MCEEKKEPLDDPSPYSVVVAEHLQHWGRRSHCQAAVQMLSQKLALQTTTHIPRRTLRACAERCRKIQVQNLDEILTYISQLSHAKIIVPDCLLHRIAFDETPLKLKVSSTTASPASTVEVTKLFVVHQSYSALVHDLNGQSLSIHGSLSPTILPSDSTSGKAVASVLNASTPMSLVADKKLDVFPFKIRVFESDEGPGNHRGVQMWNSSQSWCSLELACQAHKIHTSSEKCWDMSKDISKGVVRCLLTFQNPGFTSVFYKQLRDEIPKRLRITSSPLPAHAALYRQNALLTWNEQSPRSRKQHLIYCVAAVER